MNMNDVDLDLYPLPDAEAPTHVVILRGIPASGKSTFAKAHLSKYEAGTVARINNDDLSSMLFGTSWGTGAASATMLHNLRLDLLKNAIANPGVRLVFIDNTNLATDTVKALSSLAIAKGATVTVDDRFLFVSLEECLRRDAARETPVGEGAIRRMYARAQNLSTWVAPVNAYDEDTFIATLTPYHNDESLPSTLVVDMDGTLALMQGRSPYAWSRVGEDLPNPAVVDFVRSRIEAGEHVIIASGREDVCFRETQAWLARYVASNLPLYMRKAGDRRPDAVIKHEIFQAHIADRFHVRIVLDDRNSVIRLWRGLGLTCWQVADGGF